MPAIRSVATAVPPHRITQEEARAFAERHFRERLPGLSRLLGVFGHAGVSERYFSVPVEWFTRPHSWAEKNRLYLDSVTRLCEEAISRALAGAGVAPSEVDHILFVNTTGLATPSIDAHLVNRLGLRSDVRRTPIWGLGCAGGVAGLSRAHDLAAGDPECTVLLVAAELCGLTFMAGDGSRANLVACALFGEGAAAAVVAGGDGDAGDLRIRGTRSRFYRESIDVMGWSIESEGMQVVFARRIPQLVEESARTDLAALTESCGRELADVEAWLVHPGGAKVLGAYEAALGLPADALELSRGVLRDYGNMSSVTVLFVLERFLRRRRPARGMPVVLSALGPGFSSESMLVETS